MFKNPPSEEHANLVLGETLRLPASVAGAIFFDQTVQDYRDVLPEVDVPALVCTGADEKLVAVETQQYIVDHAPNARLVVFRESGHCPFLEEPDRFNDELDAFVGSLA
jgi:pimeloyl-ACP methyl ester carboxylesterase